MMSQVGHNVHNVTPRLLIMVEKAQSINIVRLLCNLGIMWDVHYHSHLGEDIWSILAKRRQLVFSGGLHQTNATITSFEGLVV